MWIPGPVAGPRLHEDSSGAPVPGALALGQVASGLPNLSAQVLLGLPNLSGQTSPKKFPLAGYAASSVLGQVGHASVGAPCARAGGRCLCIRLLVQECIVVQRPVFQVMAVVQQSV